jgi:hypothetical protein
VVQTAGRGFVVIWIVCRSGVAASRLVSLLCPDQEPVSWNQLADLENPSQYTHVREVVRLAPAVVAAMLVSAVPTLAQLN